jgi:hypothetical protein
LPTCALIERSPLWPAMPPPTFTRTFAGGSSISSWNTTMSESGSL